MTLQSASSGGVVAIPWQPTNSIIPRYLVKAKLFTSVITEVEVRRVERQ